MPDPDFQLTPPFSNWTYGYRPPSLFGNQNPFRSQQYLPSQLGWTALTRDGQLLNLGLCLPGGDPGLNDSMTAACAAVARALDNTRPVDPKQVAQVFGGTADDNIWDTIYGLVRKGGQSLWTDLPGDKTNIAKGGPAAVGKIDPSAKSSRWRRTTRWPGSASRRPRYRWGGVSSSPATPTSTSTSTPTRTRSPISRICSSAAAA